MTACTMAFAPMLHAQEQSDQRPVQPERPTVATHAHTIAPGYFEIESGVEGNRVGTGTRAWFAPTVLKAGLTSHMQLNVSTTAYKGGAGQSSGVGDFTVGLKYRLLDNSPLLGDFALLPSIKFANGSPAGSPGGSRDFGLTVIASYAIGPVAMDLNANYTRVGSTIATASTDEALWAASFGFPVVGPLSWVAELFGAPTINGSGQRATAQFLAGPTWLVRPALSLDAGLIAPFRGTRSNALYAGLVWNLGSPFHPVAH